MNRPRVSVLLPARDAADTLSPCLRSIARQTLPDFECIVVDDGSRDATAEQVADVARQDPRFRLVASPRRGLVHALQTGLAECRGDYVARMDADDVMHRARLARQVVRLDAEPGLSGVGTRVRLFPSGAVRDGMRRYRGWLDGVLSPEDVAREAFVECPIVHPTLCLRREVAQTLGYRDLGWPEDYDLILRLLAAGHALAVLPERLLLWREHEGRLSRTHASYAQPRFVACKAAFLAEGFLGEADDYVLWGHGDTGRALRRALAALGKRPTHIVELHPGRLGQRIHGAPVVPPDALRALRPPRILVSVAGEKPRGEIRDALAAMGFDEGRHYLCAA